MKLCFQPFSVCVLVPIVLAKLHVISIHLIIYAYERTQCESEMVLDASFVRVLGLKYTALHFEDRRPARRIESISSANSSDFDGTAQLLHVEKQTSTETCSACKTLVTM